jgi:hypothetical protein
MKGGFSTAWQTVLPVETLPPDLRSPGDVTQLLQATVHQVRTGAVAPAVANSVGYLCGLALRSFELNLAERLAEVEKVLRKRGTGTTVIVEGGHGRSRVRALPVRTGGEEE